MNYYYSVDGTEVEGPSSLEELKLAFFSGALLPTTQVCEEGTESWQTLESLFKPPPQRNTHPVTSGPSQAHGGKSPTPTSANPTLASQVGLAVVLLAAVGTAWFFFGGGLEQATQRELRQIEHQARVEVDRIENQVARDAERQYEIAKSSGSPSDAYVQAGIVAAAYLQAEDETNYRRWKAVQESEGKRAGIR